MFYILFVLFISASVNGIGQPHYECGENGRFEYCVDGIPGCIVGCHCHPGFYFDTETKICEPNAKLVQEYRRMFSSGLPTRVPDIALPMNSVDLEPTPTTINPIDTHVENIAKDSDDLGDWLYNQFFKTIETQVINNTDTDSASEKPPTRRANNGPRDKKKSKKRMQNKKSSSKKGKRKKEDLRRKLLRITEDDSMFDDSSSGSSDDSSNSGSSSADSSSDTSTEIEEGTNNNNNNNNKGDHKHDDKEHGHRKILYINKKPKPPLPSFIFLPNLDTAFFPPIGLPAPAVPMYPMVPVPPMPPGPGPPMPPMPPPRPPCSSFPVPPATPALPGPSTSIPPTSETTLLSPQPEHKDKDEGKTEEDKAKDQKGSKEVEKKDTEKEKKEDTEDKGGNKEKGKTDEFFMRANKHGPLKKKLRQRLRQIISTARKKTDHLPPETSPDFENPYLPEIPVDYNMMYNDDAYSPNVVKPTLKSAENVDFKYISQLIHKNKNKLNNHNQIPVGIAFPTRKSGSTIGEHFYQPLPQLERPDHIVPAEYMPINNQRQLETPDEAYYSNLGHQIASLIRKIDNKGEQRVNIEIERRKATPPSTLPHLSPFMLDNSNSPRSYWERSVRSLLKHFQPNSDESYPQKTYEDSLFNLERRVETVASTTRSLSLDDIENVIFWIDKTKSTLPSTSETPVTSTKSSDVSLNVNLLPHMYEHPANEHQKNEYELRSPHNEYERITDNNTDLMGHFINANNMRNSLHGVLFDNFKNLPKYYDLTNLSIYKNGNPKTDFRNMPLFDIKQYANFDPNQINYLVKPMYTQNASLAQSKIANLQRMVGAKLNEVVYSRKQLPNVPWLAPKLADILGHPEIYRVSDSNHYPVQPQKNYQKKQTHQSNQHYVDYNNRFLSRKGGPVPRISNVAVVRRKPMPSSYFHHEYQHLDVFDK